MYQPAISGIGLGGSEDACMVLGKSWHSESRRSRPEIPEDSPELEQEFKELPEIR